MDTPKPDTSVDPVTRTPWEYLRELTAARIALGRSGSSLPTREVLAFDHAHARAKDAVHASLEAAVLGRELAELAGVPVLLVRSQAASREVYLTRPDLGRLLHPGDQAALLAARGAFDLAITVADGLSAVAVTQHARPLLAALLPLLEPYRLAPIVVAQQGRVALADSIGDALGARLSLILIGERPGLSTPESLGVYVTYAPRPGRRDAERNCVSNIHAAGLSYRAAAHQIALLVREGLRQELTGVGLKVEGSLELPPEKPAL